jgi:hypothetical protein
MRFGAANLLCLSEPPGTDYPSAYLLLCSRLGVYVGANDTVRIKASNGVPQFVGRITRTAVSIDDELMQSETESFHPFITNNQSSQQFIRINWFVTKDTSDGAGSGTNWPSTPADLQHAVFGLEEVAITNCVIWCTTQQISAIVLIPHAQQCSDQTYGPMCGRDDCYFIRFSVIFKSETEFEYLALSYPEQYTLIGDRNSTCDKMCPATITERIAEGLQHLSRVYTGLLTKVGRVPHMAHVKFHLPSEIWGYLVRRASTVSFDDDIKIGNSISRTKQCIIHLNLSLVTAVLPSPRQYIRAISCSGFYALRKILPGIGIGVKKRHPPISSIGKGRSNISDLQSYDTINICDVSPSDLLQYNECEQVGSTDEELNTAKPSMIQFVYDRRLHECRLSIRCCSEGTYVICLEMKFHIKPLRYGA